MRLLRAALVTTLLVLGLSGTASAAALDDVFADFKPDGTISACRFSEADLRAAKAAMPANVDQFAPDFPPTLDAALKAHADGTCPSKAASKRGAPGDVSAATPAARTIDGAPPPPGAGDSGTASSGALTGLVALAIALGILAACALVWLLLRLLAWEPRWLPRARHAAAEAGYRAGATWAEFADWLRMGR